MALSYAQSIFVAIPVDESSNHLLATQQVIHAHNQDIPVSLLNLGLSLCSLSDSDAYGIRVMNSLGYEPYPENMWQQM
jgi:hypothetical protein